MQTDWTEVLTLLDSVACLFVFSVVVSPRFHLAWRVRTKGQPQIIGFLSGIMNQCFRVVAPRLIMILEATLGQSRLQNYDAILRSTVFLSYIHFTLRILPMTCLPLPLGLNLAYEDLQQGYGYAVFDRHRQGLWARKGSARASSWIFLDGQLIDTTDVHQSE